MFGFGKKPKNDASDIVIIKLEEGKNRSFYQVMFPSPLANDIMSIFIKLAKSSINKTEYLGELGGFRILTHIEGLTSLKVYNEIEMEATPMQIQDFASILLRRLEALEERGVLGESEDVAFIMGELTMLRDESFNRVDM